jgi:hypothetical protein
MHVDMLGYEQLLSILQGFLLDALKPWLVLLDLRALGAVVADLLVRPPVLASGDLLTWLLVLAVAGVLVRHKTNTHIKVQLPPSERQHNSVSISATEFCAEHWVACPSAARA